GRGRDHRLGHGHRRLALPAGPAASPRRGSGRRTAASARPVRGRGPPAGPRMIRRMLPVAALVVVVVAALAIGAERDRPGRSPAARARAIASDLRCPVCQGLSVADSPSPTARDIYDDIRRRVAAGESDAAIRRFYVDRYGQWILLRPSRSGV